jgi:hypothetical protein
VRLRQAASLIRSGSPAGKSVILPRFRRDTHAQSRAHAPSLEWPVLWPVLATANPSTCPMLPLPYHAGRESSATGQLEPLWSPFAPPAPSVPGVRDRVQRLFNAVYEPGVAPDHSSPSSTTNLVVCYFAILDPKVRCTGKVVEGPCSEKCLDGCVESCPLALLSKVGGGKTCLVLQAEKRKANAPLCGTCELDRARYKER